MKYKEFAKEILEEYSSSYSEVDIESLARKIEEIVLPIQAEKQALQDKLEQTRARGQDLIVEAILGRMGKPKGE